MNKDLFFKDLISTTYIALGGITSMFSNEDNNFIIRYYIIPLSFIESKWNNSLLFFIKESIRELQK